MIDCVEFSKARTAIAAAFATYQPLKGDDTPGASLPGSKCLASPNAFNDTKITNFVKSHHHNYWLLFAYGDHNNIDNCKKLTGLLWGHIEPTIGKAGKEKRNRLALLCFPAILQARERRTTGKKLFLISELCDILSIKEKAGHWHRDYKPYWSSMAGIIEKWDMEALDAVYLFIQGLDRFIQVDV